MDNLNIQNLKKINIKEANFKMSKNCTYQGRVKYNKKLYLLLDILKTKKIKGTKRIFRSSKNNLIKYNGRCLNLINSLIYKYKNYIIINPIIKSKNYFIIYQI